MILDSGTRREFPTGAVRDIAEDKGRCDLLPLDTIGEFISDVILIDINNYIRLGDKQFLYSAINSFLIYKEWDVYTALLEVAKHYSEGCKKYGPRNWEKGINLHCYIDSGVRHYLKYLRGDKDEPHDRAFLWNIFGALWTQDHHPELIDLPFKEDKNDGTQRNNTKS